MSGNGAHVRVARPVLAGAVSLFLAACGSAPQARHTDPASASASTSPASATTPSTPTAAATPTTDATWAAIGQLDPCALSAVGHPVAFSGRVHDATSCTAPGKDEHDDVAVTVGDPWNAADLEGLTRTTIAGYDAWVGPAAGTSGHTGCFVLLPAGGTSVHFQAAGLPDCTSLVAQVTTILTRLAADPHAYDLASPRPVACQLLGLAGATGTSDRATACTAGSTTAWLVNAQTYPDDAPVALGSVHAIRSQRLPARQGLQQHCSVRWTVGPGTEAVIVAPTCDAATALAHKATAKPWTPPAPGPLPFYPADGPGPGGA